MQQRRLGSSNIQVSAIGLGCMGMSWAYGTPADETEAISVIHRAIELGVTLFDTADVYGPFTNETLVGKALLGKRDQVTLATKCGLIVSNFEPIEYRRDGSPAYITAACEASLKRLNVDVIDLYYLHRPDPNVPIEDSMGAMLKLLQAGKIRAIGLSECDLPTLERAIAIAPISALQSELSLWTRDAMPEILPWCSQHDVAFLPFAPLGRGFLTGKITSNDGINATDFRYNNPRFQADSIAANQRLVDHISAIAARLGATNAQIALAWVLAQGDQVIPIPGTKRLQYLEENVAASAIQLTPADLESLNELPTASGTRY
ncbi:MAG: aldo/keto reductase [Anaerolineae bacterium]|nr:aldo/keto reductase [Anaerolineae bacterium]